jgi:hypothetical protein
MGMAKVQPMQLTDTSFLRRLRSIAQDSGRVIVTGHAKQRMRERRINLPQVLECLRCGRIYEPAHLTIRGDWKATVEHQVAGDLVRVAVALEKQKGGELAVVVTVMD